MSRPFFVRPFLMALLLLSTLSSWADGGTVLYIGGTAYKPGANDVITFFRNGLKLSSRTDTIAFATITFGADRAAVKNEGSDPGSSTAPTTANVQFPAVERTDFKPVQIISYIEPVDIYDMSVVTISVTGSYTYQGSAITPQYVVKNGEETLTPGTDYDISITNNHNAGTATITCTGKGKYDGTKSATFEIKKATLTVTAASVTTVYGAELPNLTYQINGFVGSDGPSSLTTQPVATTEATSSSTPGSYDINVGGGVSQNYEFNYVPGTLTVTQRDLSSATVTLDKEKYVYTGQPIIPEVTVELDGKSLVNETDYVLNCSNNTNPGTASLSITGKGNYTGSVDTTFVVEKVYTVSMTIDGVEVEPMLLNNNRVAFYQTTHGSVRLLGYNAFVADTVTVTVMPAEGYVLGSFQLSEETREETLEDGTIRYKYAKPAKDLTITIVFDEDPGTGISDMASDGLRFTVVDASTVRVNGAEETAKVSVYDARGQQVDADVQRLGNIFLVRLARQPQGLYIIKVNNNTFKIYKK